MLGSVAPLRKTDQVASAPATDPAVRVAARANPDEGTHFYELRHRDSTSTANDQTHIAIDLSTHGAYTYDGTDPALSYTGTNWSHVANQSYTTGDYKDTESFSNHAGDSMSVTFTGTSVRWISSSDPSHGISDVYLDGTKVATVDGYAPSKGVPVDLLRARRAFARPAHADDRRDRHEEPGPRPARTRSSTRSTCRAAAPPAICIRACRRSPARTSR
jgi:hypothetical protein